MDHPSTQLSFLQSKHSTAEILEIALGLGVNLENTRANRDMIARTARPNNDLYKQTLKKVEHLALYVPSSDTNGLSPLVFGSNEMTNRSDPLFTFIDYFVYMTNNDMLHQSHIMKGLEFLPWTWESTFLPFLLDRNSVPLKIFMRKIFPSIVDSGNTTIAKAIIDSGIDLSNYRHPSRGNSNANSHCMSIAVCNEDQKMVELLCKEKFSTNIYWRRYYKLPWNSGNLDILRTLLLFGADPECFVLDRSRGFPLVDAASQGNLEAVNMLLAAGANVNTYDARHYGTALQAAIYTKRLKVAEILIERVHICTMLQEEIHHLRIAATSRRLEGSITMPPSVSAIDISSFRKKKTSEICVSILYSAVKGATGRRSRVFIRIRHTYMHMCPMSDQ